jgi:hypothetical protein
MIGCRRFRRFPWFSFDGFPDRPDKNRLISQPLSLVCDPGAAVQALLHEHGCCSNLVMDLIEPSVVSYGKVIAQGPLGSNAQNIVQVQSDRNRSM